MALFLDAHQQLVPTTASRWNTTPRASGPSSVNRIREALIVVLLAVAAVGMYALFVLPLR